MSTSNKRSIDEIDIKDNDKDARQVPGSSEELIDQVGGLSKRHQSLSIHDLDSTITTTTSATATTTTVENTKVDQESISTTTINNDQKESPIPTNENNADNKLVDRDLLKTAAKQVPITSTEQQEASTPNVRKPVSTPTETPREHHQHQLVSVKEPTIFSTRPVDDIALYIADIIGQHCRTQHVEIK
ncbi:hypothetical protein BDC45DRAFT_209880 [Circinella umbellata]|nr:hypothetical protein BDC45DRAFT_209880 [Circinella umbellata]